MNKVLLTGRLTRDPELRVLASGKNVTTFSVATNEYVGSGKEKAEFHSVVTWDRLADICASYLGKGMTVAIEGRIQTRQWDDDRGAHHWKTEIVATAVEMLSGRRKKDYAADALAVQANALGVEPAGTLPTTPTMTRKRSRASSPATRSRSGRASPPERERSGHDGRRPPLRRPSRFRAVRGHRSESGWDRPPCARRRAEGPSHAGGPHHAR